MPSPSAEEDEGLHLGGPRGPGSPGRAPTTEPPPTLPSAMPPQNIPSASIPWAWPGSCRELARQRKEPVMPRKERCPCRLHLPAAVSVSFLRASGRFFCWFFFLKKSTHLCWEKLPFNSPLVSCSLMFHVPAWDPGLSIASEKLLSLPSRRPWDQERSIIRVNLG